MSNTNLKIPQRRKPTKLARIMLERGIGTKELFHLVNDEIRLKTDIADKNGKGFSDQISMSTLSRLKTGGHANYNIYTTSVETAWKISQALGCKIDDLLD